MVKKKIIVLTGAGISAESGLKTFRDSDGLWEGYDINEVATATAWRKNPSLVQEFYNMRRKSVKEAKPNPAHYALAELENDFDVTIITQNIDDLHERGGSTKIVHLHGEILKMRSDKNEELIYAVRDSCRCVVRGLRRLRQCVFRGQSPTGKPHLEWLLQRLRERQHQPRYLFSRPVPGFFRSRERRERFRPR